jgi:hypothetical protein
MIGFGGAPSPLPAFSDANCARCQLLGGTRAKHDWADESLDRPAALADGQLAARTGDGRQLAAG